MEYNAVLYPIEEDYKSKFIAEYEEFIGDCSGFKAELKEINDELKGFLIGAGATALYFPMEFVNQIIDGHIEYYRLCQEIENGEVLKDLQLMKELGAKEMGKILIQNGKEIWSSIKAILNHPEGRGMLAVSLFLPNPGKAKILKGLPKELQIRLSKMDIPKNSLVPGGGLIQHELNGGHTLLKHVGKTIKQLIARFKNEPGITGSSSFLSLIEAEKFISQTLISNKVNINDWLRNQNKKPLRLSKVFNEKVGVTVKPDMSVHESKKGLVVIKRDLKSEIGYTIHTSFPVID